ncbi:hypothetical protein F4604DRAFT_1905715 [Suillus subluteus]|nr:hypothetical protein F4604DRAFT_1905715 [Suillus subluteus]
MSSLRTCSEPGCNEIFTKFVDFKRHEAAHSVKGYICTWPGCDFATMIASSYEIHYAKHTGEKRYVCPNDGCDYKIHDPAQFTRHRQKKTWPPAQPPPGTFHQPVQPQPIPPRHTPFYPTPYKPQPTQYQPPPPVYNPSLGVFYDSADTADDYTMYTSPARAPNGWTEGYTLFYPCNKNKVDTYRYRSKKMQGNECFLHNVRYALLPMVQEGVTSP